MNRFLKIVLIVFLAGLGATGLAFGGMIGSAYFAYWFGVEEAREEFKEVSSVAVVDPPTPL